MTEPTEERVVGAPRCCCSAIAGGADYGIYGRDRELMKQTARIRRYRFQIATLRFRVQRPKCQRRLARARHAGEDNECVTRKIHVHIAKIVLARSANTHNAVIPGGFSHHAALRLRCRDAPIPPSPIR